MDNQDIFGSQINMQNNMRTVHFGIFHLFKKYNKKYKHDEYKNLDAPGTS